MNQKPILSFFLKNPGRFVIVLLAAFFSFGIAAGQNMVFNHLDSEDGLSQNSVLTIAQDYRGFMWFGTGYGLNKYDTRGFKIYKHNPADSTSISNDYILSSLSDSKKTLWFGTSGGLNKYNPETDSFTQILAGDISKKTLSNQTVNCIYEDRSGRLWVGTSNGLNLLTDRKQNLFKSYFHSGSQPSLPGNDVRAVFEDSNGNLWVGTTSGLSKMTFQNDRVLFESFVNNKKKSNSLSDNFVTSVTEDLQKNIWIGTKLGGLNLYQNSSKSFIRFGHTNQASSLIHNNIRRLMTDKSGKIWIGTLEGLSIFDPVNRTFQSYQHNPEKRSSLSQNSLYSIFQDASQSVWLGTYFDGVNIVYSHSTPFNVIQNGTSKYSLSHNVVSAITADEKNNLWVGTEGGGINFLNEATGTVSKLRSTENSSSGLSSNLIKSLVKSRDGKLWIGMHLGGLNSYDPQTGIYKAFHHDPTDPRSISSDNVNAILEDKQGRLWVGTDQKGINILNRTTGTFDHYSVQTRPPFQLSGNFVRTLFEDSKGNIWVGTGEGLNLIEKGLKKISWIRSKYPLNHPFPVIINCISEDTSGVIWVGSYNGGLTGFDPNKKSFKTYTQKDGLPNDNVLGILSDGQGNLWVSTDNGLCRFDVKNQNFKNYNTTDGLSGNEFRMNAAYRSNSGEMFFGGVNGMVHFFPDNIEINEFAAPVVFTSLKLFNKPVGIGAEDELLAKDIGMTDEIKLSHSQNIFTLDFALLNYIKPGKNSYAYKLEGFEKDWNYVNTSSATYTNLPAGKYTFLVKGANNDGLWSKVPARLIIEVLPPFWKTWWAYCLYAITFTGILWFVVRYFYLTALFKREHELQQVKLDFFTNVSHEIRTHLTLIQGPVERLIATETENTLLQSQLTQVRKNAERLLRLVSELMDFRKAETNHLQLQITRNDLVPFLREVFSAFSLPSQYRSITSVFESNADVIELYFDQEQLEKVIFNLLSNAYKFTQDGGSVTMITEDKPQSVEIRIVDNGKGIAPQYLSKLFENFFQVYDYGKQNTGYGIGLALSKSIVELHKGKLTVESRQQQNNKAGRTCFTIILQKGSKHFDASQLRSEAAGSVYLEPLFEQMHKEVSVFPVDEQKPTILLVEDNSEVREFVVDSLSSQYQIIEAENGKTGWDYAAELIPDLIVSDVMMAEMDGLTLCTKLKTDQRTSHIPVILLTAKASLNHQLSGLKTGADAYISKPFSIQVLEVKLRNLLASRRLMREKYSRQVTLQPRNLPIDTVDEQFLNRIVQITEELMDNPEFGVVMLAEKVNMSQSVLYKKLKAITDMSVNDFLKSIRLKKAAQLLEQNKMTVYEVAYAVGYDDRKYFSKEFKKQFGKTPSEYAAKDQGVSPEG
ncbi:hybrid sensor histidine kinase/response regulator transcription factor [Dyadobacter psychrotolerans]|uniref:histidine kinase n=1 Tax=Dyadobacter psychrotolerans TaxID=2541721 RepID=A0A4R5DS09_9BACT|nr:hybrid sensor histidine kinase/response regulator transcription factor [Dyadobacter psychrotolerans]TDE17212.1 hybrid sensor histidine kinase/response regulator [Dyadobacter psychrotolerans]